MTCIQRTSDCHLTYSANVGPIHTGVETVHLKIWGVNPVLVPDAIRDYVD
jgi:hypothetical protein